MDWRGEMMSHSWEDFAADLANAAEGPGGTRHSAFVCRAEVLA